LLVVDNRQNIHIFLWLCGSPRTLISSFLRFPDHKQQRTTVDRTPLDAWSSRRRDCT